MSDVIDFSTKESLKKESQEESLSVAVLRELLKESDNIQDVLVFTLFKDGDMAAFHTGLDVKDRCYILQLLQADIQQELFPTEEIEFEDDL